MLFTERRWHYRHAQIVHLIVHLYVDPAVLRTPFFGDIECRHDFDTGCYGRLEMFYRRRTSHFVQKAVNTIADSQIILERFEMYICRALLDGVGKHLIQELDDRRIDRIVLYVLPLLGFDDLEFFDRGDAAMASAFRRPNRKSFL
jgi:hypothetical protein